MYMTILKNKQIIHKDQENDKVMNAVISLTQFIAKCNNSEQKNINCNFYVNKLFPNFLSGYKKIISSICFA